MSQPARTSNLGKLNVTHNRRKNQIDVYFIFLLIDSTSGESNGKLPPRTCPGCSVPDPHRSHDWALVPANPASKAEY